jgi:predicted GNAT family acetyltransferase
MLESDFHAVEANLRESFRMLAHGRPRGDVLELPGVTIASLGVSFQMFNAAFFSSPIASGDELEMRLDAAQEHFSKRNLSWSLWVCEDWLDRSLRRRLSRVCDGFDLHLTTEMPGMTACALDRASRPLQELEFRRVERGPTLDDFRAIGSNCFHVPILWFSEVFDETIRDREFICWVGYHEGVPVSTAATVRTGETVGLYNIATTPGYRGRGFGEAVTRHAVEYARPAEKVILQSTTQGLSMYHRMGFDAVTRILVYNSL